MMQRQRGAALLEFAVALPFSLLLFIGIGDFSVYFWRQTQIEEIVRLASAKIVPAPSRYAAADARALFSYAQLLQGEIRQESGPETMTIALTRDYACPEPSGGERQSTAAPSQCKDERIYLGITAENPVGPLLSPLRALGYPKTTFARHVIRLQ